MPRERGSAIIESALVLVVFMMLTVGLTDAARMIFAYNEMPFLAHEGARYAAVHGANSSTPLTCGAVIGHIQGMAPGVVSSLLSITVNGQSSAGSATKLGAAPTQVTVTASYTLNPFFRMLLGGSTIVSGRSMMQYAQ
jgi:Flp pilus assembly protein TadG